MTDDEWAPIPDMIVCGGRALDRDDQPVGPPCGARFHRECWHCFRTWQRPADWDRHRLRIVTSARAAGWRLGPPDARGVYVATCPSCSQPSQAVVKLCADMLRRQPTPNRLVAAPVTDQMHLFDATEDP